MYKVLGMMLLLVGVASVASAVTAVPEIDPVSGTSALALMAGGLFVVRGRRK